MVHLKDNKLYIIDLNYTENISLVTHFYLANKLANIGAKLNIELDSDGNIDIMETAYFCTIGVPFYRRGSTEYYVDNNLRILTTESDKYSAEGKKLGAFARNISLTGIKYAIDKLQPQDTIYEFIKNIQYSVMGQREKREKKLKNKPDAIYTRPNINFKQKKLEILVSLSDIKDTQTYLNKIKNLSAEQVLEMQLSKSVEAIRRLKIYTITNTFMQNNNFQCKDYDNLLCRVLTITGPDIQTRIDEYSGYLLTGGIRSSKYYSMQAVDKEIQKLINLGILRYNNLEKVKNKLKIYTSSEFSSISDNGAHFVLDGRLYHVIDKQLVPLQRRYKSYYWSDVIIVNSRIIQELTNATNIEDVFPILREETVKYKTKYQERKIKQKENKQNEQELYTKLLGLNEIDEPHKTNIERLVNKIYYPKYIKLPDGDSKFDYIEVEISLAGACLPWEQFKREVTRYRKVLNRAVLRYVIMANKKKGIEIPINMFKYEAVTTRDHLLNYKISLKTVSEAEKNG